METLGFLLCGQSPTSAELNTSGKGWPYVTGPEQLHGGQLEINKWTEKPRRLAPDNSIFITVKGAGVGTIFYGCEAAIGRDIYAFHPSEQLSAKFVEHALRCRIHEILRNARGDIPGLSKDHILNHRIALPPLAEQHEIVNQIEAHNTTIDTTLNNLEYAMIRSKILRQSILKRAFEGKLLNANTQTVAAS